MNINIGIPQALLYHEFGSLWTEFFKQMGIPFTVSEPTNKTILDRGTLLAIDESCLPLKIYLGHVETLLSNCTHIFVPRVTGYHNNYYLCAKFAGLSDIVKNTFHLSSDKMITPNIENKSKYGQLKAVRDACQVLRRPGIAGLVAYTQAKGCWKNCYSYSSDFSSIEPQIAVIGHSYILQDNFFCRDIFSPLAARGVSYITSESVSPKILYNSAKHYQADIYWQLSAKIAGAVRFFSELPQVVGIMMISSFGCGPDSLVNEYLTHHVLKKGNKPYLIVNLDEHTGSAGTLTRIEAFLDLVDWRAKV